MRAKWRAIWSLVLASSRPRPQSPPRVYCAFESSSSTRTRANSIRQPSTKAIGRSRERSNYAAPAGKDTMCCEGLGTFGMVIGDAEL